MKVYRVSKTKYANDLSGEGSRLFGGRWNEKMAPCIYTSESRALAILEYSVNVHIDEIPRALSLITLEIWNEGVYEAEEAKLPGNWKSPSATFETKRFGTNLLKNSEISTIKIPSTVVPEEFNYILNPIHFKGKIKIVEIRDFIYDIRLKAV